MQLFFSWLFAVLISALALPAWAELLVNPSFEQPVVTSPDFFQYYYAGDASITGWTIDGGSVDVQSSARWSAQDGLQSVDLTGVTTGGIYQDLNTQPGKTYHLSFWFTGNPELAGAGGGPFIKMMKLSWGGSAVATLSVDVTGKTNFNLGWTEYSYDLVANAATTRLQFDSLTGGFSGPMLDDLSVTPVPEPGAIGPLGFVLAVLTLKHRNQTRYS